MSSSIVNAKGGIVTFEMWMAKADEYMESRGLPIMYPGDDDPRVDEWDIAFEESMAYADEFYGINGSEEPYLG